MGNNFKSKKLLFNRLLKVNFLARKQLGYEMKTINFEPYLGTIFKA